MLSLQIYPAQKNNCLVYDYNNKIKDHWQPSTSEFTSEMDLLCVSILIVMGTLTESTRVTTRI